MKKSTVSNLIITLVIVAILIAMILFFMPKNADNAPTLMQPNGGAASLDNTYPESESINEDTKSVASKPNNTQLNTPSISETFINKIEMTIAGVGTRLQKMNAFINILADAESDDEKITALQALSTLSPIEYTDELILMASSNQESEKVRATAIQTLNDAYLLEESLVEKIGGSTVFTQSEKISNYMDEVVNDSAAPLAVRKAALFGYPYTNDEKALSMSIGLLKKQQPLSDTEAELISATLFSNTENLNTMLPALTQNPNLLTDELVMQMSTLASEPVILQDLSDNNRQALVALLQDHKFNPADSMSDVNQEVLQMNLLDIANKNIRQ